MSTSPKRVRTRVQYPEKKFAIIDTATGERYNVSSTNPQAASRKAVRNDSELSDFGVYDPQTCHLTRKIVVDGKAIKYDKPILINPSDLKRLIEEKGELDIGAIQKSRQPKNVAMKTSPKKKKPTTPKKTQTATSPKKKKATTPKKKVPALTTGSNAQIQRVSQQVAASVAQEVEKRVAAELVAQVDENGTLNTPSVRQSVAAAVAEVAGEAATVRASQVIGMATSPKRPTRLVQQKQSTLRVSPKGPAKKPATKKPSPKKKPAAKKPAVKKPAAAAPSPARQRKRIQL